MSSSKCSFTCICGIFWPLNPSTTTVYARSAFYPSLHFTLSLQSAFYTQSAFYPWSAVCSPQSAVRSPQSPFYIDRIFFTAVMHQSICLGWHFPGGGDYWAVKCPRAGTEKEGKCPVLRQYCNIFH